jgi:hypothetical protein
VKYDPAADLAARYPDWVVRHACLGWGIHEVLSRPAKVILLEATDSPAQRRCSLAHAVAHLDRGHHAVPLRFFDARQELDAQDLAARRLITVAALAAALSWSSSPAEIASELVVDRPTLSARLRGLGRDELAFLELRASGRDEAA